MITGNIGEWSEIYALFKLLGEGKMHAGDANMNKLDLFYPILNIIRKESQLYEYKPNSDQKIVVLAENGEVWTSLSMNKFVEESKKLLETLKSKHNESAFSIPETEDFMKSIRCQKLKAPSTDKADIQIVIHDLHTNMTPQLGFSIKSQLGHASTLLNPGKPTNIQYKVVGLKNEKEAQAINSIDNHIAKVGKIFEKGYKLEYCDIKNNTFKNNLLFIDSCLPQLIAYCLVEDSKVDGAKDVSGIIEQIASLNPFNYNGNNVLTYYEHKMKQLLLAAALGMTSAKEWNGRYDANGGYLVVKKDGEIVCYHFYNVNNVEDYLFQNTKFDRASRSRYNFGKIYQQDGEFYFDLNLQIRFKK